MMLRLFRILRNKKELQSCPGREAIVKVVEAARMLNNNTKGIPDVPANSETKYWSKESISSKTPEPMKRKHYAC